MGKVIFQGSISVIVLLVSVLFCFYPAAVLLQCGTSSTFKQTAQPPALYSMYQRTAARYGSWATHYLASETGKNVKQDNVSATEWPMFGSVFFLLTSEEMHKQHPDMLTTHPRIAQAIE